MGEELLTIKHWFGKPTTTTQKTHKKNNKGF
jgi:hypothetical protein